MKKSSKRNEAMRRHADYQKWFDEQVRLGIVDADAGNLLSDAEVKRYFELRAAGAVPARVAGMMTKVNVPPPAGDEHGIPHFHLRCPDGWAVVAITRGQVLAGDVPPKTLAEAVAWSRLHQDELLAEWKKLNPDL